MTENIEHIGKKDILWSYAATGITIGAGVILLPFILHKMSTETVGIWNIFQTAAYLVLMVDFGFRPSFSRSISFVFSGVKSFDKNGVSAPKDSEVDYSLLYSTICAMKKLYRWLAIGMGIVLLSVGTLYFYSILDKYTGDRMDALIAWFMLVGVSAFNLYTYYYDALLEGKGYILKIRQITIAAQLAYVILAIVLIECGLGLTAIVAAQITNIIIKRIGAYRVFYTKEMKERLRVAADKAPSREYQNNILKTLAPNAIKSGLTGLGGFLVNKSAILIGGAFLSLEEVAYYGITIQVLDILLRCASIVYQSYIPKLAEARARKDYDALGRYYRYNVLNIVTLYAIGGVAWITLGNWALSMIGSETQFIATNMLIVLLIISLLEVNHATAAGFIQADNRIPFFIPSLLSGAATIALLYVMLYFGNMGIWALILAPGIAQLAYQNWKWPCMLIREITIGKRHQA